MELKGFFERYPKVALAFSGGVDSAYLLYAAKKYGADVKAFFVKSQFQPEFELRDAEELAHSLNADMEIIYCDVLADAVVADNPENRCYYCKHRIFDMLRKAAGAAGYTCIIDGTNASDLVADRPGMKALAEMEVLSPLRLCGLTKEEIRSRSKEAGLFTWNKPSYACLATRVPVGEKITREKLQRVEASEKELTALGFSDFRIRLFGGAARIQLREDQMEKAVELCGAVCQRLKPYFEIVLLDLEGR
ncbi:ATP-dependent sacrificial sulfur transferase LarE [Ihubacter sp. rT4E-8]|uniref:ATP-dependent sacrificial sulfur transferase LarE n=1 Tax=Ihubacter sp. rT4E-8 TaxID=3242369 RepID=UPI003CEA3BD4